MFASLCHRERAIQYTLQTSYATVRPKTAGTKRVYTKNAAARLSS